MKIIKEEWKLFGPIYSALFIGIAVPDIDMLVMVFFFAQGFSATQVGIGLALLSLFTVLSEIPTGAIADMYGKRKSIQIGWFMMSLIFFGFFFVTKPWMMWLLFSLRGVANTFSSGAFSALPYDIAKQEKKEYLINTYYSRIDFVYRLATSLSNINVILFLLLVGSTTTYFVFGRAHQGLDLLWLTGSFGYFIGAMILFKLKEKVQPRLANLKDDLTQTINTSVRALNFSKSHHVVRKLMIFSIFGTVTTLLFSDIVYQSFLMELGVTVDSMAIFVAVGSFIGAFFSLMTKFISDKFNSEKKYLRTMLFVKLLLVCSMGIFTHPIISMVFFFVYFGFDSFINPVIEPFKQYFYQKDIRATISSIESFMTNLVSIVLFPIIGYILDTVGSKTTVMFGAIPILMSLFILKSIMHNQKIVH